MMNKTNTTQLAMWFVTCLVAAMFLLSGIPKLFDPGWIERFARWGYAAWFMYVIVVLEILGAIGLLVPKTALYAALGLIVIMLGAMYTHLSHDQANRIIWNMLYILLLGFIAAYRRGLR